MREAIEVALKDLNKAHALAKHHQRKPQKYAEGMVMYYAGKRDAFMYAKSLIEEALAQHETDNSNNPNGRGQNDTKRKI